MLTGLHARKRLQLVLGLSAGVLFGVLLHKGGVTSYDVILGQLLLEDFTVVKVMLTAVVVGMVGVHLLRRLGLAELHVKSGSWGSSGLGGLVFGVGFAVLGYCPGTIAGAVGNGRLDALVGGLAGILLGAGLFAVTYPRLQRSLLGWGTFAKTTFPEKLGVNAWVVIVPVSAAIVGLLFWIVSSGL